MSQPISADFPFTLKSVEVHGARMTYVDEGRGDPIVFLHGNPTSSYLWRNIIPYLTGLGRCIAPDLIGMGRSDKPELAYRFVDHARYVDSFLRALDLDRITFVLHDWGSALGFDWAMSHEGKVRGVAFMEAILGPMPSWDGFRPEGRETFQALRTPGVGEDRKSTRLNSSHLGISYAVFCLKKKKKYKIIPIVVCFDNVQEPQ